MRYDPPLLSGHLQKRYKRFLADIVLDDGTELTVHCANPGSMLGLTAPGNSVFISDSQNPKRKLRYSLEQIEVAGSQVSVNTHQANALVEEAIAAGRIEGLTGYGSIRREVKYGQNSRIDFLLEDPSRRDALVEVKSVTLSRQSELAEFPDSVTSRGTKHLYELIEQVKKGKRAVQLFVIQRSDCKWFRPASDLDAAYADALRDAQTAGVEILIVGCHISREEIAITRTISMEPDHA